MFTRIDLGDKRISDNIRMTQLVQVFERVDFPEGNPRAIASTSATAVEVPFDPIEDGDTDMDEHVSSALAEPDPARAPPTWIPLATVSATGVMETYSDTTATMGTRMYRVVLNPVP